jgi:hypothetical protein
LRLITTLTGARERSRRPGRGDWAPGRRRLTAQGHPRTIFRRALERGNLVLAEVTAREIGRVDPCSSYSG